MNYSSVTGVALAACLLLVQPVSASEPLGKVLKAKTQVSSSGEGGRKSLDAQDPIFFMDRLTTNATGTGEFIFDDGTKLALGPSASLVVDRFVQKGQSSFSKFGVSATKGTFRWISGSSASAAYKINTPTGTMGVRGTAFDVTTRNGRTHVVLLNGKATFCVKSGCQSLRRTGDYISTNGRSISDPRSVKTAFKNRQALGVVFPFLANPRMLSARFRVPGAYVLFDLAEGRSETNESQKPTRQERAANDPAPREDSGGKCRGNCGNGKGKGGGNGTKDEGSGNDP